MNLLSRVSVALLVPMTAVAVVNLVFARRLRADAAPGRAAQKPPRVSLLIPARDEEANLRDHLPGYLASDYPDLEILVLDDESSDGTAEVVRSCARPAGSPLAPRLLTGRPLPSGWLGKPWACHQLASAATGEILIFCDADVDLEPAAIRATVDTMTGGGADVLTAFPRHRFDDWLLAATIPLVTQLPVSALMPLPLVPRRTSPAISVGNGQWLAFTRQAYDGLGGHQAVRGEIVEDVELARTAKRARLRVLPVLGGDHLAVRMYRTREEMYEGFRKNLYALAGGTPVRFVAFAIPLGMATLYPVVGSALRLPGAGAALGLLALLRLCAAWTFHHRAATILFHPVGAATVLWIGLRSFLGSRKGTLRWKGRTLPLPARAGDGIHPTDPARASGDEC